MDISKNKIIITIGKTLYTFKSSYSIVNFFSNSENIKDIELLTDDMKYILTRSHIIQRVLKLKRGEVQDHFVKQKTKDKYLNINNFQLIKV